MDADVLHLGQNDLPVPAARRIIGERPVIGRSTHVEQARAASVEEGVDYFCADRAGPPPPNPVAPPPAWTW